MCADNRTDVLDQHVGAGELLLYQGLGALGVFNAVGVQHDDGAFFRIGSELQHLVHDEGNGLFVAADLVICREGAVRRFGNDGLKVQHGADGGSGGGDASAALEVLQVVNDEVSLGTKLVLLQPAGDLFNGLAGTVQLMSLQDQQGHGAGNPQGVHHDELPLRILFQQLFPGTVNGLQGAAELAGEGDEEQILSFFKDRLEIIHVGRFIQRGGDRNSSVAHSGEIALVIEHLTEVIKEFPSIQGVGHINDGNIVLLFQVKRQVTVAVGHKNVILFHGGSSFRTYSIKE